ncbi:kinase-like domain-containing protein [Rhizophagus irregularis DAOM 181602=DAOM 197198]|nr:kinase-like domain-containing protein [Rhizophagus irregularis DAOM 181602=DAOM 197198]
MEILNKTSKKKPSNLWKIVDSKEYHNHVTISTIVSATKSEEIDDKVIYMDEIEKRKEVYGICEECDEPGTGEYWCQLCNAKRFEENFKNWTSGNKDIDELIQLNAVYYPNTKDYMMVLEYCENGNLRNYYLNNPDYNMKLCRLSAIANGLLSIHNAGKVHKDFHSGNILCNIAFFISDLGMCQPANNKKKSDKKGVYGVLPYMAPEVLRGYKYTKAADIY